MKKSIPTKNKISPEKHIKIEPFRKGTLVTPPHKHKQYFEIIFLSQGSGHHWIDGHCYDIKPPVFFFLNREQVHNWQMDNEPEGYVVIFKNTFLQQSRDESLKQLLPLIWHHRGERVAILVSEHKDGELIARLAKSIGYRLIRGSSSRGGERALLALAKDLRAGREVAVTPDGPRGPARR